MPRRTHSHNRRFGFENLEDRLALAAVINNVAGDFRDGGVVTLKGAEFGAVGPDVVIFDDFESGTNEAPIKTGPDSATVGEWDSRQGTIAYSSGNPVSGSLTARADMADHWLNNVTALLPDGTRDVFVSYWTLIPNGTLWPGEGGTEGINWKTVWVMGTDSTDDDRTLPNHFTESDSTAPDPYLHSLFSNDGPDLTGNGDTSFGSAITRGVWHRTWVWLKGRTDNTGAFQLWELTLDGVRQQLNANNVQTLDGSGTAPHQYEKIEMNAFGNQAANSHPTFDDFYVAVGAGARARVEIGNKPNYADCTELAITTPTHWTDTEIRTTIRQGLFDEGQTAYLFVVTANGVVSQGRAIKIGTSPLPTLTISDPAVREGDAGTSNVVFTVTLSAPSEDTVMVDFATEDYTAKRGTDYVHRDNALTFNPGETKKTVSVRVIGDLLDEPNEKIRLNLSNASGAVIGDRRGVATIHDNDPAPTLTINDVTVVEGNSGTVPARFIVTLSAASGRTVTVKYASANGTAASPADYYAKALAMLTFLPGQTTKTVAVWVRGDTLVESRETFFLNLSSAVNATIADTRGIGAILDDDDPSS